MTTIILRVDADDRTFHDPPQLLLEVEDTTTYDQLMGKILDHYGEDEEHLAAFFMPRTKKRTKPIELGRISPDDTWGKAHRIACYDLSADWCDPDDDSWDGLSMTLQETPGGLTKRDSFWALYDFGTEHWYRCRVEATR